MQVKRQQTPLTWAVKAKDVELIQVLAEAGANPTLTDAVRSRRALSNLSYCATSLSASPSLDPG